MSLYSTLAAMLNDIDTIRQALELMASFSSVVESTDPERQLEVLAQTLAVDAQSPDRLDGSRFWHSLLHFQCDELETAEDPVFRLDALIKAGLEWQHKYCDAMSLYEDSFPEILSPGKFYSKRKPATLGYLDKRTLKEFPLALQARVRLQRSYVKLYKARDRTREVQHTLPYKVAAEISIGWWDWEDLYNLCLGASEGQGCQEGANAWKVWESSKHPVHFLALVSHLTRLSRLRDYDGEDAVFLFEPKLLEFLKYELPKSSWKFFKRVNTHDSECVNFNYLHQLCQIHFPLSGKYNRGLMRVVCRSRGALDYLPGWIFRSWGDSRMDSFDAEKVLEALQLDTTPQPWEGWGPVSRSRFSSFDAAHWTETLIKVVGENSPRNLRSKDLVQIFKYFKSGWSSQTLTSRQLTLVEKWITESGCEKLKALSELYINRDLPSQEVPF